MFALPNAKRVRRSDLHSPSSSRSSSPASAVLELFKSKDLDYVVAEPAVTHLPPAPADYEEDEVEFQLFARPAGSSAPTRTVIQLRSPSPVEGEDGVLGSGRPEEYYFRGELAPKLSAEYDAAALSGEHIRCLAELHRPGSVYSWKVTTLPASRLRPSTRMDTEMGDVVDEGKRKRLGKKMRIKKRKALAAVAAKSVAEKEAKADKERADREKKAKRNRDKKFKKRARDKAKKALAEGGGSTAGMRTSPSPSPSGSGDDA
ncbi:hypothetical protein ANO11243_003860 [Dothideomycetidae sp. 11243]|nr:hypothetical protein ANO11243_003860 [fungal sp. No.11243]